MSYVTSHLERETGDSGETPETHW